MRKAIQILQVNLTRYVDINIIKECQREGKQTRSKFPTRRPSWYEIAVCACMCSERHVRLHADSMMHFGHLDSLTDSSR